MKINNTQKDKLTGWSCFSLKDVCLKFLDGDWIESKDQSSSGFRIIQTGNIGVGVYIDKNSRARYISPEKFRALNCTEVLDGDLLISRLPEPAGRSALLELKQRSVTVVDCTIVRPDIEKVLPKYLLYFTNSSRYFGYVNDNLTGSTRKRISRNSLSKVPINLPSIREQNYIIAILETWDKVIKNLSKKIEIKNKIKKALMHDLLIGKSRLRGFSKKWQTTEIGELLDYEQPSKYIVDSTDYHDGHKTPVLTANKGFVIGYTNETNGIYKNTPVIIFDDFTMDNKYVDFEFKVKSSAIKMLTPKNKDVNLKFVFERMQLINVVIGEHRRHYLSEYQYHTIDVPDIEEQNAIENILTTADKEINTLEKKLAIIKEQKRYLLNNLITGKIRTPETLSVGN